MAETNAVTQSDDDVLAYTQSLRKQLVNEMIADGKMPIDNKDRMVLLTALTDMDRQALTKKRINTDDKNADADRQANLAAAAIMAKYGTTSPFKKAEGTVVEGSAVALPETFVDDFSTVPGEMDIGVETLTYDEFVAKVPLKDKSEGA